MSSYPTNNDRARWAMLAIRAFIREVGGNGDHKDDVADLVCDLMHFCDALHIDWDHALFTAEANYAIEIVEDGGKATSKEAFQ